MRHDEIIAGVEQLEVLRPLTAAPHLHGEVLVGQARHLGETAGPHARHLHLLPAVCHFESIESLQHEVAPETAQVGVVEVLAPALEVDFVAAQVKVVGRTRQVQQLLVKLLQDREGVIVLRVELATRRFTAEGVPRLLIDAQTQLAQALRWSPLPAVASVRRSIDLGNDLNAAHLSEADDVPDVVVRVHLAGRVSAEFRKLWIILRHEREALRVG